MSEVQPPASPAPNPDEIPLADIDALLAAEDPEFTKSLEEVRAVANAQDVEIEASAIAENLDAAEVPTVAGAPAKPVGRLTRWRITLREKRTHYRAVFKARLASAGRDLLIFLKHGPRNLLSLRSRSLRFCLRRRRSR